MMWMHSSSAECRILDVIPFTSVHPTSCHHHASIASTTSFAEYDFMFCCACACWCLSWQPALACMLPTISITYQGNNSHSSSLMHSPQQPTTLQKQEEGRAKARVTNKTQWTICLWAEQAGAAAVSWENLNLKHKWMRFPLLLLAMLVLVLRCIVSGCSSCYSYSNVWSEQSRRKLMSSEEWLLIDGILFSWFKY